MRGLLAAIKTAFEADGTLTGTITGGIHFMEAAPGTAGPYLIYHVIASPTEFRYGTTGPMFAGTLVQFTLRAVGANEALENIETFCTAFQALTLTISGKQVFFVHRTSEPIPEPQDPTQDQQARDTYGWIVTYEITNTI